MVFDECSCKICEHGKAAYWQECCPAQAGDRSVSSHSWDVKVKLMESAARVPEVDRWRMDYLARLLTERGEASFRVEDSVVRRLTALIDSLCVN